MDSNHRVLAPQTSGTASALHPDVVMGSSHSRCGPGVHSNPWSGCWLGLRRGAGRERASGLMKWWAPRDSNPEHLGSEPSASSSWTRDPDGEGRIRTCGGSAYRLLTRRCRHGTGYPSRLLEAPGECATPCPSERRSRTVHPRVVSALGVEPRSMSLSDSSLCRLAQTDMRVVPAQGFEPRSADS